VAARATIRTVEVTDGEIVIRKERSGIENTVNQIASVVYEVFENEAV
jgi:hypothetical protein